MYLVMARKARVTRAESEYEQDAVVLDLMTGLITCSMHEAEFWCLNPCSGLLESDRVTSVDKGGEGRGEGGM